MIGCCFDICLYYQCMFCFFSQVCNGMNNFCLCLYSYNCFVWNIVDLKYICLDFDYKIYLFNFFGNDNYMIQENFCRGLYVYMFLLNIYLYYFYMMVWINQVDIGICNF